MPKLIDHTQRREDIINGVWELIVVGGIESVTMRNVASKVGLANGALRHTFSGKDEIVQATYERTLQTIHDSLIKKVDGLRGLQALEAAMLAILPTRAPN